MITPDSDLLTVEEAAILLRVSRPTIRRWIRSGRLRAIRPGPRTIRVRRQDLETVHDAIEPTPGAGVSATGHISKQWIKGRRRHLDEMLQRQSGVPLPSSRPPIRESRAQRGIITPDKISTLEDLHARMLEYRHGEPLPSSVSLIRESRDEGYGAE